MPNSCPRSFSSASRPGPEWHQDLWSSAASLPPSLYANNSSSPIPPIHDNQKCVTRLTKCPLGRGAKLSPFRISALTLVSAQEEGSPTGQPICCHLPQMTPEPTSVFPFQTIPFSFFHLFLLLPEHSMVL